MTDQCGSGTAADACAANVAAIHLAAGDLVGAYRAALPMAQSGDAASIDLLIELCERAGDKPRSQEWRARRRVPGSAR
jgi:hypothetical protein